MAGPVGGIITSQVSIKRMDDFLKTQGDIKVYDILRDPSKRDLGQKEVEKLLKTLVK